jgi:hypothetical protein
MASGVPIVATDVGGNPELIIDGETGILVPVRDAEAIEKAVRRIISDRDYFIYLSYNARTRVRRHFDLSLMVSATAKVYEDVLGVGIEVKSKKDLPQTITPPAPSAVRREISEKSEGIAAVEIIKFMEKIW